MGEFGFEEGGVDFAAAFYEQGGDILLAEFFEEPREGDMAFGGGGDPDRAEFTELLDAGFGGFAGGDDRGEVIRVLGDDVTGSGGAGLGVEDDAAQFFGGVLGADGEGGVIGEEGFDPDEDGVMGEAQLHGVFAGLGAGDPL
ncbi:MAG: hypothetical protein RI897_1833 [Verrucomicrobiota bacterium]